MCNYLVLQILKFMKGCFVSPAASLGFDELTCHCGASVIYPPVPCGTRPPECTQTCARVHECDHPGGSCLLASTPHSLLTLCHLGCCMMVFTAVRLHCGSPSLFPVLGLLLWRWVWDLGHSWESQCLTVLYSVDVKHTQRVGRIPSWSCLLSLWPPLLLHISKLSIFL